MAIITFKGQDACAGDSGGPFVLIKGQNISKGIFLGSLLPTMKANLTLGSFFEQSSAHFWRINIIKDTF